MKIDLEKAKRYNTWRKKHGWFEPEDFHRMIEVLGEERIVALYQEYRGLLPVDGMFGPGTSARLAADNPGPFIRPGDIDTSARTGELADLEIDHEGVFRGAKVRVELAYPGWYYPRLLTASGQPEAIYWHYTATNHGTARAMSAFRQQTVAEARAQRDEGWGPSSWTAAIEHDGWLWQMVRAFDGPWCIRPVRGLNWTTAREPMTDDKGRPIPEIAPNYRGMHFELVAPNGRHFTNEQIETCERITRVGWEQFGIGPDEHYSHDELSKGMSFHHADPGPLFMNEILPAIHERVFGAGSS